MTMTSYGRRVLRYGGALVAAALCLTACAAHHDAKASNSSGTSGASGPSTSTLSVAYTQPLQTLDPIHSDQNQTNTIDDVLYDTLASYNSSNVLIPALATSFTLSADAKSVNVTLRSGVKFHDGSPFTSADVKYSFDRYVSIGQGIASELATYSSTTVIDSTHLTINLKKADALFLGHLSKLYIVEQKLVTANAGSDQGQAWLQTHDAGSGPYQIANGTVPVRLTRFADFWDFDATRPSAITFAQIAESATKAAELKSGQLDIALDLQTADAKAAAGGAVKVSWMAVPNTAFIFMNTASGATANPVVRKALRLAYNYAGGLSTIRGGEGTIENGPLPQTLSCVITTPPFSQNLAEAKSMLAQAGLSDLKLTLRFQPSISDQVREATLFQSDLKTIGVTLDLVPITFPDYLASLSSPTTTPEMTLVQDTAGEPDAGIYLLKAYDSIAIGSTNRAAYKNPQVDSLLATAETTTDANSRCSIYKQVQTLINADSPSISMYTLSAPVAYRDGVNGIVVSPTVYPISLRTVRF